MEDVVTVPVSGDENAAVFGGEIPKHTGGERCFNNLIINMKQINHLGSEHQFVVRDSKTNKTQLINKDNVIFNTGGGPTSSAQILEGVIRYTDSMDPDSEELTILINSTSSPGFTLVKSFNGLYRIQSTPSNDFLAGGNAVGFASAIPMDFPENTTAQVILSGNTNHFYVTLKSFAGALVSGALGDGLTTAIYFKILIY